MVRRQVQSAGGLVALAHSRYSNAMFEVLVYLYQTYYRPEACPQADVLFKKLSAAGFAEEDISQALDWLRGLAISSVSNLHTQQKPDSMRFYTDQEYRSLGVSALGLIHFLEQASVFSGIHREIVLERALAVGESPLSLDKLRIIVLMLLWSQGKEPDALVLDELLLEEDESEERVLH